MNNRVITQDTHQSKPGSKQNGRKHDIEGSAHVFQKGSGNATKQPQADPRGKLNPPRKEYLDFPPPSRFSSFAWVLR